MYLILLSAGITLATYGTLRATYTPFQLWLYKKERGISVEVESQHFMQARFGYITSGSSIGLIGLLLIIYVFAEFGFLG